MNSLRTAKRFVFPLLGLWVVLYASFSLGRPPLLDGLDSIQAEAAREMAVHGDWVTPHVNGIRSVDVSPLLTWCTAAGFRLFGVSDWAARLVLALFALALFLVVLSLGVRLFLAPVAGFYAALILMTSAGIFLFGHLLYPQLLSTLWLTLAVYYFWRSLHWEHASRRTAAGFAAACALGVLTGGLSGLVVPVVLVLAFLGATRNLRHLLRWHPGTGSVVFLVITVPWLVAVHRATGVGARLVAARGVHGAPFWLVWLFLLIWILPWCFFSIAGLVRMPRPVALRGRHIAPSRQVRVLLILWIAVVAVYVAFTRREEFSVLPALPALALLAGGWMAADEAAPSRSARVITWVLLVGGLALAAVAVVLEALAPFPQPGTDIASLLRFPPGSRHLFLSELGDLTLRSMGAFRIPLVITAASLAAGVAANFYFRLRRQVRLANCFLAGMMTLLLVAAEIALMTFSPVVSSAVLANAIKPEVGPNDLVAINGRYRDASALAFYLQRTIHLVNDPGQDLGRFSEDQPNLFETPEALAAQWDGAQRIFLWTTPSDAPALPGAAYRIARVGGREILSNQPNAGGATF